MRRAIATVSLSGMLREKLQAIAAARFDGVEIFENDLLQFSGKPREVRALAADLGLAIDMFQPFRDFDAATPAQLARSLDRAERKFDVMAELGTGLILVCSNVQPDAPRDTGVLAEQFRALAERAAARGMRIAYEALAWGSQVRLFSQAWAVVERVSHPNLGLCLDSFHTLSLRDDPQPIARLPGERIFYVQLADAPWVNTDVLTHSRHYRCFPGQGEFDVTAFLRAVLDSGYAGTISLEIFNDEFRSSPARANAVDAMRSLLWLEEQVRLTHAAAVPARAPYRVPLFDPPPPPRLEGWSFIEFAVDPATAARLGARLLQLGFARIGRHRSKHVELYAQGEVRIVLNLEQDSFARSHFDLHGTSVCALALACGDARAAVARAEAFGCTRVAGQAGADELDLPAVGAPDGSLLYFCGPAAGGHQAFEADFLIDAAALRDLPAAPSARIDHVVQAAPGGQVEPWVLFQRAVLGLVPQRNVVLHDPYGVIRSREIESADKVIRYSLMVSERDNTVASRSVARYGGAGVQQVAIAVDDVIATARELRRRGAPLLPVPGNYYDDLAAKYDLDPAFLDAMRAAGVLYERAPQGEFVHAYTAPFEDRFEFEFVERRGGYELYGSTNSPVRLAALAEWRATHEAARVESGAGPSRASH
jgi:4-hydroxyphenylpyruvate dioxygenase